MNLILSGRGVELSEPLRRYATEKLTRVERFFDRIVKMEVQLHREPNSNNKRGGKRAHRVDVTVQTPGETLRVHGEAADDFAAIDQAADRLETQIKKHKGRLQRRNHRTEPVVIAPDDEGQEEAESIVRVPQRLVKPLAPEEARLELESRGLNFVLFTNAESMRAAVLFRRDDGGFGLIEHEG